MALVEMALDRGQAPSYFAGVTTAEFRTGDVVVEVAQTPTGGVRITVTPQVEGLELRHAVEERGAREFTIDARAVVAEGIS